MPVPPATWTDTQQHIQNCIVKLRQMRSQFVLGAPHNGVHSGVVTDTQLGPIFSLIAALTDEPY
jgi:hypothetical protein